MADLQRRSLIAVEGNVVEGTVMSKDGFGKKIKAFAWWPRWWLCEQLRAFLFALGLYIVAGIISAVVLLALYWPKKYFGAQ